MQQFGIIGSNSNDMLPFFQIYSSSATATHVRSVKGDFAIDKTLGRDVSIEISYQIPEPPLSFQIIYPNGTIIRPQIPVDQTTYVYAATNTLDVSINFYLNIL